MKILKRLFPPPTRQQFAHLITAQLRRTGVEGPIKFDLDRFLIRYGKKEEQTIHLRNCYDEYVTTSICDRRKALKRFANAFTFRPAVDGSFDQLKHQLLPRVRERFYYQAFELSVLIDRATKPLQDSRKAPLDGFAYLPLNEDLTIEVVLDLPDSIRSVTKSDLTNWSLTFDDAMSIAKDNLWRASNHPFTPLSPGLFASPWHDTHDVSRMFLHDLVWHLPVTGDHVVAIPNRNLLYVTGSEDTESLISLARLIDDAMQQPRPMTGQMFRLVGTHWQPFIPPIQSPAHWPIKRVTMKSIAKDYAEQKDLLESLHNKSGEDIYVAKQALMRREEDRFWTWTSWVKGVTHALMPAADFVTFGVVNDDTSTTKSGFARWDRVVETVGHLMETTELYPPRYRIRAYPTDEQVASLELTKFPDHG